MCVEKVKIEALKGKIFNFNENNENHTVPVMISYILVLFGVTNNRVYNDAFRTFIYLFNAAKCIVYISNYHMTKNQDNSFNLRFQNWERSTIEKTTYKHGENSSFPLFIFIFLIKTRLRDFLLDIDSAYKSFV